MSKIIIATIIFILSILINICSGSPPTITILNKSKSNNPISTNANLCIYTIDYLLNNDIEAPSLIQTTVSSNVTINQLLQNSTSSLYRVYFINVPLGSSLFQFSVKTSTISTPYSETLSCIEFEPASIKTLYKSNSISKRGLYTDRGLVKITGSSPFTQIDTSTIPSSYIYVRDNIFTISNLYFPIEINYSTEILFYNRPSINITVDSFYIDTTNSLNLNSISVYPNKIEFNEMGLGYSPLISFKDNSAISNPYYSITNSVPRPVYSINGETTYIGSFNGYVNPIYTLYTQINKNIIETISYNVTVNKILLSQYQASINVQSDTTSDPTMQIYWLTLVSTGNYDFNSFTTSYIGSSNHFTFPYGFSGTNTKYLVSSQVFIKSIGKLVGTTFNFLPTGSTTKTINVIPRNMLTSTMVPPKIIEYSYQYLYEFKYLISLNITSSGISTILIGNNLQFGMESYSTGSYTQSLFEMVYDASLYDFSKITIFDIYGLANQYDVDSDYYSINPPSIIESPPFAKSLDIDPFSISDVSYKFNNIDVTNQSILNTMYFNLSNNNFINRPIGLLLTSSNVNQDYYYAAWDSINKQYSIEFIIPMNSRAGIFPYQLIFGYNNFISSSNLPDSQQLILKSSNFDGYGPIFTKFTMLCLINELDISFTIQDLINGFSNGDFILRGSIDNSIHTAHIDNTQVLNGGNIWTGDYIVKFKMPAKCISQNYTITNVILVDTMNIKSIFSMDSQLPVDPIINPFINFLDNQFINTSPVQCSTTVLMDSTKPNINDFSGTLVNGVAEFSFGASSPSGIYDTQLPIIYLQTYGMKTIECISKLLQSNSTYSNFSCSVSLERGFGSQGLIIISVYGLINNGGYYNGFSSYQLGSLNFTNVFKDIEYIHSIEITGNSKVTTNSSGNIWIQGIGFENNNIVYIMYYGETTYNTIGSTYFNSRTLVISNIKITNKPFTIKVVNSVIKLESNEYIITPLDLNVGIIVDPPITNAPQSCLGNPQCGGPNHGYCSLKSGCICYSPWIGNDCLSKVLIIPQPQTNTTNPSTEIPITNDDGSSNNNNTSNYLYKSLISLISIREFDINSIKVNEYQFDKWVHNELNPTTSEYLTNITVPSIDGIVSSTITSIKVTLQWYKDLTNITFANQQLLMNPSTIKYTIEFSSYKFKTALNTLQLIMSASISSTEKSDICSAKEFGETTSGDNSNYLKVQIQDHSLYGRFIKRAIIDNQIKSISNTPLDSSFNSINSASSIQSFIGINIPNYKSSLIVDPDFSVLLDNNQASDNGNSICSSSLKPSKLTNSQLAGIIVGSSVIFLAIIGAGIYIFIKKRNHTLILLKVKEIMMHKK